MSSNLHPIFRDILAAHIDVRPPTARAPFATTSPAAIASVALQHAAMDDTMSFDAVRDVRPAPVAEHLADDIADMKHTLRRSWQRALDNQHALSTPKLPTVEGDRVVMVPVTELVGTLMDLNFSVQLLADALRTGDVTKLHIHLRQFYVDGYAADLVRLEWSDA